MKKLIFIIFLFTYHFAQSQRINYDWIKQIKSTKNSYVNCSTLDSSNNIYIAGLFSKDIAIDDQNISLSDDNGHAFIAKIDSSGKIIWLISDTIHNIRSIKVSKNGNIFITGSTMEYITGSTMKGRYSVWDTISSYVFLAKYSSSGQRIWIKTTSIKHDLSSYLDHSNDLVIDNDENIYFTGCFVDSINFQNSKLTTDFFEAIFLAKVDSSGDLIWNRKIEAKKYPNSFTNCCGNSLVLNKDNYVYLTGTFRGGDFSDMNLNSINEDVFIAKIDTSGDLKKISSFGGPDNDNGRKINIDKNDNISLFIEFSDQITIYDKTFYVLPDESYAPLVLYFNGDSLCYALSFNDLGIIGIVDLDFDSNQNTFIAYYSDNWGLLKVNHQGKIQWHYSIAQNLKPYFITVSSIQIGKHDGMFLSGDFKELTYFGTYQLNSTNSNAFIGKVDTSEILQNDIKIVNTDNIASVFPTISKNYVTIHVIDKTTKLHAEIINSQGMVLISDIISNNDQSINLESLSRGLYFLRLSNNRDQSIFKIVKTE